MPTKEQLLEFMFNDLTNTKFQEMGMQPLVEDMANAVVDVVIGAFEDPAKMQMFEKPESAMIPTQVASSLQRAVTNFVSGL